MQKNITANSRSIVAQALSWGTDEGKDLTGTFDIVLAADVVYCAVHDLHCDCPSLSVLVVGSALMETTPSFLGADRTLAAHVAGSDSGPHNCGHRVSVSGASRGTHKS